MELLNEVLSAVIPSVGVGLLFWWVMRVIIHADRRERQALARIDAEEARRAAGDGVVGASGGGATAAVATTPTSAHGRD